MINRIILVVLASALFFSCKTRQEPSNKLDDLARYVSPYIGSGGHGHVFVGANVPFGAVQLGPVNMTEGWDWCSGYNYADSTIIGFSHTHLSGTGIGDLGDILVMPFTGDVKPVKGTLNDYSSGYYSLFDHNQETVSPGYYGVQLSRYNIKAELTTTERTGLHRYHFPDPANAGLVIDLKEGIGWDLVTGSYLQKINDTTIVGSRFSTGWAVKQEIYFTAIFSGPITSLQLFEDTLAKQGISSEGKKLKAIIRFASLKDSILQVKVGISPVSMENAGNNLRSEADGWDFAGAVSTAREKWNKELNKIRIETADTAVLRNFYTAMYHTMISPSIFNDANGQYKGTDKKIYPGNTHTNMTIFSLWDTYRALNPYYTLIQEEKVGDMISSMLAIYQQKGCLPVWHLAGNETNTMPGNSAVPIIADAVLKGIKGFDKDLAWEAVKNTMLGDSRGLNFIKQPGYIPADSMVESVAMAMEYSIADAAIAKMAKHMGKQEDFQLFQQRGLNYRKYFDPSVGFMRGKTSADSWRTPFSPFVARHMKDDFCEGNSWQYTWLVPQDVEGLMKLMGGEKAFIAKLDSLFVLENTMGHEASADITGLVGQYAHGNEPGHHIPYLYAYAGQPWKTAEKVRYILDSLYNDTPHGLSGNEDAGQMSAWYILSSLGFYQVNPSGGLFVLGSPNVDRAVINTGNGKQFIIEAKNNSNVNKYIQGITLNGKSLNRSYFTYEEFKDGGTLVLEMGPSPSNVFGVAIADRPFSSN